MFDQERQHSICTLIARNGRQTVRELQSALGASPATIRRDLTHLDRIGRIIRVHGGAIDPGQFGGEKTFDDRGRRERRSKAAIADSAVDIARGYGVVYVDAGTTCLPIGRRLLGVADLTIYTNSIPLAATPGTAAEVVCIGGTVKHVSSALVDGLALGWIRRLRFPLAFIGASGLSATDGASASATDEAALKQLVIERSERSVLVADSTKWDRAADVVFADWPVINDWICDDRLAPRAAKAVRDHGVNVILA
tara:strand:- start:900 stop:1655 length:756 start_codon:yes stop_codon:yes gene_type:complete